MRTFSEGAVSSIVRALIKDRRDLSESLKFWRDHPAGKRLGFDPLATLNTELQENATALLELANGTAPWLKHHPQWHLISNNLPTPRIPKEL